MNKKDLIELFEMFDVETLESLYLVSKTFTKDDLRRIAAKMQDKSIKNLIINYL